MPIIILMRHAHAELPNPGMRDFDRPLSAAGWEDARTVAKQFPAIGVEISEIFCSPARRTMETLACVRETVEIGEVSIHYPSELYSGEVSAYHHVLSQFGSHDVCMIIGHNPMIEQFAFDIAQTGDEAGLAGIKPGYPTAAMAVIDLGQSFNPANPQGRLLHFLTPD
jgi:phosphohistidine phosphatase